MPEEVKTDAAFKEVLGSNNKVAVDFTATWCGPCRMIGPKFEEMEKEYPDIKFIKVDVDENSETSEKCGISAMPTFQAFFNGDKVLEVVGASEAKLKEMLEALKSK